MARLRTGTTSALGQPQPGLLPSLGVPLITTEQGGEVAFAVTLNCHPRGRGLLEAHLGNLVHSGGDVASVGLRTRPAKKVGG